MSLQSLITKLAVVDYLLLALNNAAAMLCAGGGADTWGTLACRSLLYRECWKQIARVGREWGVWKGKYWFHSAVAANINIPEWHGQVKKKTVSWLKWKLREAIRSTSEGAFRVCLFRPMALAKPEAKLPRLFGFLGLFYWKATKSWNKHPLNVCRCLYIVVSVVHVNNIFSVWKTILICFIL